MHSRSSVGSAFVPTRRPLSDASLTEDRKRVHLEPLGMFSGLEGETFHFIKDVATAAATGAAGDAIAQLAEKKRISSEDDDLDIVFFEKEEAFEFDVRRSLSYATFAGGYTGAFQHYLFAGLQDSIADPIARVAINQGLIIPLCYYSLLVFLVPKLRARTPEEEESLRSSINVMKMIPRNWAFWVPLQFIQFNYIPTDFQVVYCSCLGLIWNVCLSFLTAGSESKALPLPETAMADSLGAIPDVTISVPSESSTWVADSRKAITPANSGAFKDNSDNDMRRRAENWMRLLTNDNLQEVSEPTEVTKEEDRFSNSTVFGR